MFRRELEGGVAGNPAVAEVRGRGLFLGVELRDPDTGGPLEGGAVRVAEAALREGLLVLPAGERGEVLEISPPLVLTEDQIRWAVPVLAALFREVARSPGIRS
jgi:4-aminobutyrate aminotransferase-like enzyme